ncbi:folylpolyglutamate synthase/dihydrofolate synthase [Xenococcus sp. PCC 7305]|uniref:bifunctional folylpolyglutamate synthase/dihydrofolate synthase n=1 Tax=Xenococcus sp. PCC 7305 TaxID=102125 RepID=UPI0002ABB34A|nr:folylpolyglutamate synthase/dihydrofolate synthase family protein [Xenococcus sp. PCC 7305]ELS03165.1 folylpolyglutamate synthase/dihydrofolate synthase [Xenococcus sp. PCC 7305]
MTEYSSIDSLLQPFKRFGVNLGLARIKQLLVELDNPQDKVPIIHVAGTNGKGSVCAYLSAILTATGYRVGRYTSPHLVSWSERISLNEQPIKQSVLLDVLQQVIAKANSLEDRPTQFEVFTAAAWLYFAQSQVDLAVMEVGLGGRLDATNVCDRPLLSIITSISREHWQRLGPTIPDITGEKAGVLKANCPAVIGKLPPEAIVVVQQKIAELNCPTVWIEPAVELESGETGEIGKPAGRWAKYEDVVYPLPLLGDIQLHNSAIAIASCKILQQKGWAIAETGISEGMAKTQWPGRLQWTSYRDRPLLIDGAHNTAAAIALRHYLDTLNKPVTFIMGMLSTKDHQDVFQALLRPHDQLHLVTVPGHSSADPKDLAVIAQQVCPQLSQCKIYDELFVALDNIWAQSANSEKLVVFCGSLYLIGYFFANNTKTKI